MLPLDLEAAWIVPECLLLELARDLQYFSASSLEFRLAGVSNRVQIAHEPGIQAPECGAAFFAECDMRRRRQAPAA